MPVEANSEHLRPSPQRIPEKLKAIRRRLGLTRDAIAKKVGAKTGAEIKAYEEDEDELLVSVLYRYANLAGCPIDNLLSDDLEVYSARGHKNKKAGRLSRPA